MVPVLRHKGKALFIDLTPLVEDVLEQTELTATSAAGASTLTVRSIAGFAINQILLIGELGYEGSEIVTTHAATAPTGSTITLSAALTYAHSAGTKIYRIQYNQIEITNSATVGGAKVAITGSPFNVQADELLQGIQDTANTSGYYYARYKETIGNTFSDYTDYVPYGGRGQTTAGKAIEWALKRNGLRTLDGEIDLQFCIDELNDFMMEWQGTQMHWPEYQNLNADIGTIVAGTPVYALPADIYDNDSNKSILRIRIGDGANLAYLDPLEFERWKVGENSTKVATQAVAGDTTLVVVDADDFDDTNSVLSFVISGVIYHISYTSVDKTTNTFSGIPASGDGAITVTLPVDTYIFQGAAFGRPLSYTIRGGYIEFDPVPGTEYNGRSIYGDYWTAATEINSEGDEIDATRFDAGKYYLAWKIRMQKKNDGSLNMEDGYYQQYRARLSQAVRNKPNHIKFKSYPRINRNITD